MQCPDNSYINKVYHKTGSLVNDIGFRCSDNSDHYMRQVKFNPWFTNEFEDGIVEIPDYRMYNGGPGLRTIFKPVDDSSRFTDTPFSCPDGTKLTGMRGKYNTYVGNVEFQCCPFN